MAAHASALIPQNGYLSKIKNKEKYLLAQLAGPRGFEPRFSGSEGLRAIFSDGSAP
jgi:hypothetical protein